MISHDFLMISLLQAAAQAGPRRISTWRSESLQCPSRKGCAHTCPKWRSNWCSLMTQRPPVVRSSWALCATLIRIQTPTSQRTVCMGPCGSSGALHAWAFVPTTPSVMAWKQVWTKPSVNVYTFLHISPLYQISPKGNMNN